ncbi:AraC family transcriptional regulator ligand-binding domain-containing protein [Polyangium mundeleinium]|uniref:AraC family transcriptional regulator ligand-binding domain-containing protein n=1 Tax=Polyangium mundeleinium TaxID=2995306 RepID=A0ABT5EX80_9BACT|nr:AraC family transcriptional regulator ligand-binding domain-containing protein [Polyangium mundeleinium]MDC0746423.1 AraC family transcriptional regulator ligand-binding domain-containing protein [Polyangium mundeleinium]
METICAQIQEENLGLRLALEADPSWMSLPGVLGMSLTGVREAIEVGCLYGRKLRGGAAQKNFHVGEDGLLRMIHVPAPHEPQWPRHFIEAGTAAIVVLLRRLTDAPIEALRVSFPHRAPEDISAHVSLFGTTDIRFEAPSTELVLPASVLELRPAKLA